MARFHDPPPSIGYLIWHLALKWRVALDRALAPLGLTAAHYSLLASLTALSRHGPPSQRELADFSGLEPMYVSKLSRVLESGGLLTRLDHPADSRAFQLALTPRGVETVTRGIAIVHSHQEELLAPLGGRTSRRTVELMGVLRTLLRHAQEREALHIRNKTAAVERGKRAATQRRSNP
jgi:MarR family transcriptional regulator, organic hydroperoxide resistance regulator